MSLSLRQCAPKRQCCPDEWKAEHGEDSVYTLYIEDEPEMIFMSVEEIEHLGLHYDAQNDEK